MAWSKRDLVHEAFRECGLASYDYDLDSDEMQTGLSRLNGMMGNWEGRGVRCSFNFAGDLGADSGIPDLAAEAVYLNLARRIAPGFGKTLTPETIEAAKTALDTLFIGAAQPQQVQQPASLPRGIGAKSYRQSRPFNCAPSTEPLQVNSSGGLDFLG